MAFSVFGPGAVYITRTDIANGTPVNIGYAQEMSIDLSYNTKQLFGQNQYPLDVARSTAKTSGKIKAAQVSGVALNSAFFGQTFASGLLTASLGESHSVPATTPFTAIITPPNTGTFDTDLGVTYAATGLPLQKVGSVTAAGQYSESAGTYTFDTADASAAVLISYAYTGTGTTSQTLTVANQLIGVTPTFQLDYLTTHNNKTYYARLFQCIASKLTQQFKLEDYMIPELDFEFFANAAGNVMKVGFPDVG